MQVMIEEAGSHIGEMIDAALRGEDVTLSSATGPVLRLVAIETRKFTYGVMADRLKGPVPDFLEPMSEDDVGLWEGGGEGSR